MSIECRDIPSLLAPYLDGELTGSDREAFESHSSVCAACAQVLREEAQFAARIKTELAAPPAPDTFKARLHLALDKEDRAYAKAVRRQRFEWALPGAAAFAAAAALLVLVVGRIGGLPDSSPVAQEVIRQRFEQPIPVMRTGSRTELSRAAQELVQIPIRPPRFAVPGVTLKGYRIAHVQGREAPVFVYEVDRAGKHNTMDLYVFDSNGLDLRGPNRREKDGRELWLSEAQGLATVSYKDDQQIGYVFRSDMSATELADLVEHSDLLLVLSPPVANE